MLSALLLPLNLLRPRLPLRTRSSAAFGLIGWCRQSTLLWRDRRGLPGDVHLRIGIRRDGSVASAEIVSGHPMLQAAALVSAQKSTFSCSPECTDEVTTFLFTYTFGLREGGSCFYDVVKLRSRRCLYLWRCGIQQTLPSPRAAPAIGTAPNQVIILADSVCVETESSSSQ